MTYLKTDTCFHPEPINLMNDAFLLVYLWNLRWIIHTIFAQNDNLSTWNMETWTSPTAAGMFISLLGW